MGRACSMHSDDEYIKYFVECGVQELLNSEHKRNYQKKTFWLEILMERYHLGFSKKITRSI
jgi:hypothetical protein